MHPDVTAFVSRSFYEGRLGSEPHARTRPCSSTESRPPDSGRPSWSTPVIGCGPMRRPNPCAISSTPYPRDVADDTGVERPIALDDIVVVAPYNAQVACLVEAFRPGPASALSIAFRDRRRRSASSRWPRQASRICPAILNSCSASIASTWRCRVRAVSPFSSARRNCFALAAHAGPDASRQRALPLCGDGRALERRSGGGRYAAGMTRDRCESASCSRSRPRRTKEALLLALCDDYRPLQKASWTVKDNVAHLSIWREHAARYSMRCGSESLSRARRTTAMWTRRMRRSTRRTATTPLRLFAPHTTASYAA